MYNTDPLVREAFNLVEHLIATRARLIFAGVPGTLEGGRIARLRVVIDRAMDRAVRRVINGRDAQWVYLHHGPEYDD